MTNDYWGAGRRAAIITDSSEEGRSGARFNFAFRRGDSLLVATAIADRVSFATVLMAHADQVVASVRLEGE
ncbi:hypothetical protein ASE14_07545 [Agromyces sp. Root81]|uniref:hypothetical protein n=1 Tax=Agromyces sp. Root81 TaxID=1736601 RepID=UPI0006F249EE|nr:hypothetical protein [Agromyces sp. Root81]KRC60817.1 hypothetical protein ASE14_07545 [Agromyces sp. Root81]